MIQHMQVEEEEVEKKESDALKTQIRACPSDVQLVFHRALNMGTKPAVVSRAVSRYLQSVRVSGTDNAV